jgi:hypothetical protein
MPDMDGFELARASAASVGRARPRHLLIDRPPDLGRLPQGRRA